MNCIYDISVAALFQEGKTLSVSQYLVSVMLNYTKEIGNGRTKYFVNSG